MIKILWKNRYINLFIIVIFFITGCLNINSINVFFDSERIIELTNVEKDIIEKSIDDNNLLLLGLKYEEKLKYEDFIQLKNKVDKLKNMSNIKNVRSIFNDQYSEYNSSIPYPIKVLNLKSKEEFNKSILKLKNNKSNYISNDLKNLLFIIKCENLEENDEKELFINNLEIEFKDLKSCETYITGQIKSETYVQKHVISELLLFTLISLILCSIVLWFFTKNIFIVITNLLSVFLSIFISLWISNILFGGIELIMIIVPAVIFIITISDYMHLQSITKKFKSKFDLFESQIQKIGKPVFLTSITTAIGFLSFTFTDFEPLYRFGIITTLSIFISLYIIVTMYSLCIDMGWLKYNEKKKSFDKTIKYILNLNQHKIKILSLFLILSALSIFTFKIDNYLTDEINKKSELYEEINYFDNTFGGIKPISFSSNQSINYDRFKQIKSEIESNDIHIDFALNKKDSLLINARMNDIGSVQSKILYNTLQAVFTSNNEIIKIGGIGYLFDQISNELTKQVLFGLFIAILIICSIFVIINRFKFNYFIVTLIPNTIPLLTCLGILSFNEFYFSLSNAFIFAIVFGLIVDDSIHIISAYSFCRKKNLSIDKSLEYCRKYTYKAVIKTSIVIIFTLIPLMFSEFKSISQLANITIMSALIAIIFDMIYLPILLKKLIK